MQSKKGQGLSLNVIIIAALALIVLVVLVVVFTGRIGVFDKGVNKESRAELIKMRITYGDCQPTLAQENAFTAELEAATTVDTQSAARSKFKGEISRCKGFSADKALCEQNTCLWE